MKTIGQHPVSFRAASLKEHLFRLQSRRGFTFAELLVVIATVAILAATLLPALAASKDRDRRAACANNLRQIGVAAFIYASDNNDYLPPLKWRNTNPSYPYEMFRYTPVNVPVNGTTSTYDSAGGPYNLGVLWSTGIIKNGAIFYCPADVQGDDLSFDFYNNPTYGVWPWGGNPTASNPGWVRSGYSYFPQSKQQETLNDIAVGAKSVPFWPDYSTSPQPFYTWICVPPFKQSAIDQSKSMAVDVIYNSLNLISHKSGNIVLGLNAVFGDGHVAWQGVNQVKNGFNANVWATIAGGGASSGDNLMYVMSCWQP